VPASTDYAKGDMAYRACAAADRTGHAILHTLYQQCLKHQARFLIEYFAIDLLMDEDGACRGLLAWCLEDGSIHRFRRLKPGWNSWRASASLCMRESSFATGDTCHCVSRGRRGSRAD
jgi:hypothetical protein